MTLERIEFDENRLKIAFHERERKHIQSLMNRANHLLTLILANKASEEADLEYHSIKWCLKQIGAIDNDFLKRTKRIIK